MTRNNNKISRLFSVSTNQREKDTNVTLKPVAKHRSTYFSWSNYSNMTLFCRRLNCVKDYPFWTNSQTCLIQLLKIVTFAKSLFFFYTQLRAQLSASFTTSCCEDCTTSFGGFSCEETTHSNLLNFWWWICRLHNTYKIWKNYDQVNLIFYLLLFRTLSSRYTEVFFEWFGMFFQRIRQSDRFQQSRHLP